MASISHSFVLQWRLTSDEKQKISMIGGTAPVIRSDPYWLRTIEDLYFYLEIKRNPDFESIISIKGSKTLSFKLDRAFLATKDRVFNLKASKNLIFLNSFRPDHVLDAEEVTIHCFIIAYPVYPAPADEEDILSIKKGQSMVSLENIPLIELPSDYENKEVINFIRHGEVPNFEVSKAIKIISETKYHKNNVLKTLCAEYLLNTMYPSMLKDILKAAIEYDLPLLEHACEAQIAYGT